VTAGRAPNLEVAPHRDEWERAEHEEVDRELAAQEELADKQRQEYMHPDQVKARFKEAEENYAQLRRNVILQRKKREAAALAGNAIRLPAPPPK
jgi:hypothetical protein